MRTIRGERTSLGLTSSENDSIAGQKKGDLAVALALAID
jgi:hypothetical protein